MNSTTILFSFCVQGGVGALTSIFRSKVVVITDARTTQMNEIINSIKLIKMYAWEEPFIQRVRSLRKREVAQLRKAAMLQSVVTSLSPGITIIAAVVTFFSLT